MRIIIIMSNQLANGEFAIRFHRRGASAVAGTGGTRAQALAITSQQSAVGNAPPSYEMAKGRLRKSPTRAARDR
jgi:hypothetical protein